jgi:quercetin dioxygenase-like cupin family protein
MKSQVFGIIAAASAFALVGCSSVDNAIEEAKVKTGDFTGMKEKPGDPKALLKPIRKGEKVIVRTAFEVTPAKNKVTHGKIMQLLSPHNDNVNIKYSISSITLQTKQYTVLHTLSVPETFYVLEGNGILKVNDKDYVMRPGKLIYVPANRKQSVINNSKKKLMFLSLISPAYNPNLEQDLKKLKPEKKKKKEYGPGKDGMFSGKYSDKPIRMSKDKKVKIQTLTPKEDESPDIK